MQINIVIMTIICMVLAATVIGMSIALGVLVPQIPNTDQIRKDLVDISVANTNAMRPGLTHKQAHADSQCMVDKIMNLGTEKAIGSIVIGALRQMGQTPHYSVCDGNAPSNPIPQAETFNGGSPGMQAVYSKYSKYYPTNAEVSKALGQCSISPYCVNGQQVKYNR
jgi:hypothetical protein